MMKLKFTKKIIYRLTFTVVFILISLHMLHAQETVIKLLYVSDLPEIETRNERGGLAELGTLVKDLRKNEPNFLFLHGGSSLAPSIMSSFDYGTHMIDVLNSLLPEVMAIDDREFAHYEDELILRIGEAGFPLISSNIIDTLTGEKLQGTKSHKIFTIGGYKIGVFSVLDPEAKETYLAERIYINSNPEFIKDKAKSLKTAGADIIILLSGYKPENIEQLIDDETVDIFIQSKTATDKIEPIEKGFSAVHGSSDGNCLQLSLNLSREKNRITKDITGSFVNLNNYYPDPEVQNKINYYTEKLDLIMSTVIGETTVPLNTTRENIRTAENAFGNFVSDALRDYYHTDIAVFNGGSIRGNRMYKAGTELTRKFIQSELPYYNKVLPVYISGRQIRQMLEHGLSRLDEVKGGFLHISGMNVKYSSDSEKGKRIKSIKIGNKALDEKKAYTMTTVDYLLKGGDGFHMLKNTEIIPEKKESLYSWEVLRLFIEKNRNINPEIEGRLINE